VNFNKPLWIVSIVGTAMLYASARAEVISISGTGFEIQKTFHVASSAAKAYAVLLTPSRWWSSDHTYSGNAANLTLDPRIGGCWCEKLPDSGGSVDHMHIALLMPGKLLRMRGALGPLQGMGVDGAMTFELKPAANGTDVTMNYAVGGYNKAGFDEISKAVNQVLSEQMESLRKAIDGK
jgi:uncharacterized protein YndB with AHSA1/START domain